MKRLNELKKYKDEICTKHACQMIKAVKSVLKIRSSERVFTLGSRGGFNYFLHKNRVIVSNFYEENSKELDNKYLYTIDLLCENPKEIKDIDFKVLKKAQGNKNYTAEDFLVWINEPSNISQKVDIPFYKVIKFLQNYKMTTFKTENYLFYAKRDKDFTWLFNIYAKDLKNNAELKIYTNCKDYINSYFPEKSSDIFIEDLSGKLSEYKIKQCKKEFAEFIKKDCRELNTNNFYAMEFVKQSIQPVWHDKGWAVCLVFDKETDFHIWVDDVLSYDKKPYFLVSDKRQNITKIAVLDFFKPEYKTKGIYNGGYFKCNFWELDYEYLKNLTEFLKAPYDKKAANWKHLIEVYNDNTGEPKLPLDLPLPDYTLLKKEKKYEYTY